MHPRFYETGGNDNLTHCQPVDGEVPLRPRRRITLMATKPSRTHDGPTLADRLFPKEQDEFADSILAIPPEQRRLHTETYDYSIATITDYLRSEHVFVPRFQRGYVWTGPQASRL